MIGIQPQGHEMEKDWAVCADPYCGTRRPKSKLGPDGKCSDDWHQRLKEMERWR